MGDGGDRDSTGVGRPVLQAYQFALDPAPGRVAALWSHCGAQRFAYNWALGWVKANLAQREAERSYGIPDTELTPPVAWSAYGLRKTWNQVKGEVAPWWAANSKEAYSSGLANLATALRNYTCDRCGLVLDRDLNAARNLATLASVATGGSTSSSSCGATLNEPAGNPRKTHLVGNGYRHGKTHAVNAPPQGEAASLELTHAS